MARKDLVQLETAFRKILKSITIAWSKQVDSTINRSQFYVLERLAKCPHNISTLAEALHITSGAVTGISDKLVDEGYASRRRAENDRRVVFLEITDKGHEILAQLSNQRKELYENFFGGLTDTDVKALTRIFEQILDSQDAANNEVEPKVKA
ncbi:MarR family transcriptional regulator [Paenibacillus sp. N1-5-1-14]|uniref:MarR family winged helix-turn-helix transcriptional regulator n=1 Tax=Paenibacillus radicibacter TaxID=2972488 RepID=UPI0021596E1D|nr:MarR family transcriptional regulator [Paenibacillus radicibacter]MCR8642470.1 MarR family transcriptional regulator [Paenibacillus radicibacter]